ncbi:MAG: hypothetical protein OMM_04157 [Candidatus Magnetoglobus multicellularis str. Araruama]|uniref:Uncharacterized protein n=1 Tax=Candidatus Magnetoglobus multicellularis str. Araruama TaxID=890399 RepID=A0A1V1P2W7_9BACT|nr:MAG: hypothetical protein OMM_04157 [Candidatus Magnetoglobus multicellularis str. Araruama]
MDASTETEISAKESINISAVDNSTIKAKTNAVSVAVAFGFTGIAASVGVSLAENQISNTVESFVENVNIHTTDGDLTIFALENAYVRSYSEAVAGSAGIIFASSGGGASTDILINTTTNAYINDATVISGGDISVQAWSKSIGIADVGSTSISLGIIGAAFGGSTADITIKPTINAYIDASNISANNVLVKAYGNQPIVKAETTGLNLSTGLSAGKSDSDVIIEADVKSGVYHHVNLLAENSQSAHKMMINQLS